MTLVVWPPIRCGGLSSGSRQTSLAAERVAGLSALGGAESLVAPTTNATILGRFAPSPTPLSSLASFYLWGGGLYCLSKEPFAHNEREETFLCLEQRRLSDHIESFV